MRYQVKNGDFGKFKISYIPLISCMLCYKRNKYGCLSIWRLLKKLNRHNFLLASMKEILQCCVWIKMLRCFQVDRIILITQILMPNTKNHPDDTKLTK